MPPMPTPKLDWTIPVWNLFAVVGLVFTLGVAWNQTQEDIADAQAQTVATQVVLTASISSLEARMDARIDNEEAALHARLDALQAAEDARVGVLERAGSDREVRLRAVELGLSRTDERLTGILTGIGELRASIGRIEQRVGASPTRGAALDP